MGEPAWKMRSGTSGEEAPGSGWVRSRDAESAAVLLQRWIERPDGSLELLERPLTPEDYLNPQRGDKWLQGQRHGEERGELAGILRRHFRPQRDVLVLEDVQHSFGVPGLPDPAPDISIIHSVRERDVERDSFDVVREGVRPCLVIEILSQTDARIRRVDEKDKVKIYALAGIPEYVLIAPPRPPRIRRYRLGGYRLGPDGLYLPMEPDEQGCLVSETAGLRFGVSPQGDRIFLFDAETGRRLLTPEETEEALRAAEQELARLRSKMA
jgi:Uma2 family endonuclease